MNISGNTDKWDEEKEIYFEYSQDSKPGQLRIKGTDKNNINLNGHDHCYWAGLLLHCTASQITSPWHNFVSDTINWIIDSDDFPFSTPCQNDLILSKTGENITFISDLNSSGAKKIWSLEKTTTLVGTPPVLQI